MAVYAYKAWDTTGRTIADTLQADSGVEARRRLRDRGLRIKRFAPTSTRSGSSLEILGRARRKERVAEFAHLLTLLLRSGVTLGDALKGLSSEGRGHGSRMERRGRRWETVLRQVREELEGGGSFAEAIGRHPLWFGDVFVEAVRVGEQSGKLDDALVNLAEYLRERRSLATRVTTAMVYPMILLVVATGVVLFLMSYVIPQLLTVLAAGGQTLPASTMLLKTASDLLLAWWPMLLIGSVVSSMAMGMLLRTV